MPSNDAARDTAHVTAQEAASRAVPGSEPSALPRAEAVIGAFAGAGNIAGVDMPDRYVVVHVRDTTKVSEAALHGLGFIGVILQGDGFALLGPVDADALASDLIAALDAAQDAAADDMGEQDAAAGEHQEHQGNISPSMGTDARSSAQKASSSSD